MKANAEVIRQYKCPNCGHLHHLPTSISLPREEQCQECNTLFDVVRTRTTQVPYPYDGEITAAIHDAAFIADRNGIKDLAHMLRKLALGEPLFLLHITKGGNPSIVGLPDGVDYCIADYCMQDDDDIMSAEVTEEEWNRTWEFRP
jgi:DNA-directed RNA polymerase subunit RPC12/RpoP